MTTNPYVFSSGIVLIGVIDPGTGERLARGRLLQPILGTAGRAGGVDYYSHDSTCTGDFSTGRIRHFTDRLAPKCQGKPSPNAEQCDLGRCSAIEGIDSSAYQHYSRREELSPACVLRRFGSARLRLTEKSGRARRLQTPANSHGNACLTGLGQVLERVITSRRSDCSLLLRDVVRVLELD